MLRTRAVSPRRRARAKDVGFTLVELMVVLSVMAVVIAIAGDVLYSMQNATVRTSALISEEQDAANAIAQMARDIRSAHSITFTTPTSDASVDVVLNENSSSGGATTPVEWLYVPPASGQTVGQLQRLILTSAMAVSSKRVVLTDIANTTSDPVFAYYNVSGAAMSTSGSSSDQTLQNCTTAIGVDLLINPSPTRNVSDFTESEVVAITDQQQILSAPGNQQCGLS